MQGLRAALLVGAGGFLGSLGRYVVSGWVHRVMPFATFPYGTLAVNAIGCFVIGLLGGLAETHLAPAPGLRVFLFIGVLGGFTTFSSFAWETLALARDGEAARALANVAASAVLGLALCWVGFTAARAVAS